MRFWGIVLSVTVAVSAGVAWLVLRSESSLGEADQNWSSPSVSLAAGRLEFEGLEFVADVAEVDGGTCNVGETAAVDVRFRNAGEGPLRIALVRTSCSCVRRIAIDGTTLEVNKHGMTVPPGSSGVLRLEWKPTVKQLSEGPDLRLAANFAVNDPRPHFASGFRLEIRTRVLPPRKDVP